MENLVYLSDEELLSIDGGVDWWRVGEGIATLGAATVAYGVAVTSAPVVPVAAASAATGLGLQVAAYGMIAGGFAAK